MTDFILDQRNATVMIDPANRERLARVDPMYIQAYVSWAAANKKLSQMAEVSQLMSNAIRDNDTKVLIGHASIIAHDDAEFMELKAEIEALTADQRLFLSNRAAQKAESIRRKVQILEEAWNRNLDLEVSSHGKSRVEVGTILANDRGGVLPAEMAAGRNGNGHQPNVVVVNTGEQKQERKGWKGLGN